MKKEVWKYISGYNKSYSVSSRGRVRRNEKYIMFKNQCFKLIKGRILKIDYKNNKYARICLSKNDKNKNFSVHRLVAIAFIKNKYNKPLVNHKDGKKLNNYYKNLEWVTQKENIQHARENGLLTRKRNVHINRQSRTKKTRI